MLGHKAKNLHIRNYPHLVRRSNKKINIKALDIDNHVWNTLTGIHKHFCPNIMRPKHNLFNRKNRSYRKMKDLFVYVNQLNKIIET